MSPSDRPLCDDHDLVMLDLDGVVYVGGDAVPGAPEHLRSVRERGVALAFITNNASRPPTRVAEHLSAIGVPAETRDVVTSAQAAARVLADGLEHGAPVALLGGPGLREALEDRGLRPVEVTEEAQALVSGYGPDVRWSEVMKAAVRIRGGLWWVASNADMTVPTDDGPAPGHGVLVETLRRFCEVEPVVAGKPERPLLVETMERMAGRRPLMVGDRLDTDIAGARNAGVDSLLVMTGVSGAGELVSAAPDLRPTHVAADLGGLLEAAAWPEADRGSWRLGGWDAACADGGVLRVEGAGSLSDWWRVVAAAGWDHLDTQGEPADLSALDVPARR